jgi:hypothetical protein
MTTFDLIWSSELRMRVPIAQLLLLSSLALAAARLPGWEDAPRGRAHAAPTTPPHPHGVRPGRARPAGGAAVEGLQAPRGDRRELLQQAGGAPPQQHGRAHQPPPVAWPLTGGQWALFSVTVVNFFLAAGAGVGESAPAQCPGGGKGLA